MRFVGKTSGEYFGASKMFLALVFILAVISVVCRLSNYYPRAIQTLSLLLVLILIGWAGWRMARTHAFNLKQAGFVGFLLSFGSHWTLPIFHNVGEILYLFLVNAFLFAAVTAFGCWLAKRFGK